MEDIAERIALKELVDTVSILGDRKDFEAQVQFFTENALSETFADGRYILKINGRREMAETFTIFLKDFETVYHFNGQHIVTISGESATGTCYCLITLIGKENGKRTKSTIGAIYQDEYVKKYDRWLIAKRTGIFDWQSKSAID